MITKSDIIAQLQREILPLQGFKTTLNNTALDVKLGSIKNAFPNNTFPLGAIHEFISTLPGDVAVTNGFIISILASLMKNGGVSIWIGSSQTIFPPALQSFGIAPDKIIFINLQKEKEILWVMEEAMKCEGLVAVVGQIQDLNFTASRRLQLAVEHSLVTGFIICQNPRKINTTSCITRWKITSLASGSADDMPGVCFPRWNVELLKVKNGKPGTWQIEFSTARLKHLNKIAAISQLQKKKAG